MGVKVRATLGLGRHFAQSIGEKAQRPLSGNGWVQLTHGTGCGIAWVDKGFFTFHALGNACALALVQGLKVGPGHVDLATHFQHIRDSQIHIVKQ